MESERYNVTLYFSNGMTAMAKGVYLDLFSEDDEETLYLCDKSGKNFVDVTFNTSDCQFDTKKLMNVIRQEDLRVSFEEDDECKDLVAQARQPKLNILLLAVSVTETSIMRSKRWVMPDNTLK